MAVDQALLKTMEWRMIGPPRGGRVVAVAGDPAEPATFYFGACGGGVWKSTDGGTYWENVSDGFFKTAPVGALAVSEADPNVIYAGTGEACIRGNVIHGDGVYRSTDAGRNWQHLGLADTRHISRVRVHPNDPDTVYVAALGHAFGPNKERGVFRSSDGGKSWQQSLFVSERAGAADLSMDPHNPRLLFAAIWQALRTPWTLESGGPDSGLYRSSDGGETWSDLSDRPGLPKGIKGRIGVAVSPAKAGRVWAIVEAEEGGLFRSDDAGESWQRVCEDRDIRQRPWYYMHIFADPQDAETVYSLNLKMWRSSDGGKTFTPVTTPHGDNHDLWIDPADPQRMIEGNDGGACVSYNGGASWSTIYNQPTAQFYHVAIDTQFPYRVYGTQQDNSAISVPSRSAAGAIPWGECYAVGSSESGHIQVRPDNPNVVISGAVGSSPGGGGSLLRYDHGTAQTRIITVWPEVYSGYGAKDLKHRFQWTFPILISPHDPNTLYATGERVFQSFDEGSSWEPISPDLTRNDASKLGPSGGPITKDTTGAEHYCTVFALAESPLERRLLWAGSDDGLIHLSRDGSSWQNLTPPELPEWSTICTIEPSPHDAAVAYLAATRYKLDDFRPILLKTGDYGKSWQPITNGLGDGDITRVIREDPTRRGLLYCGTERGVYVSFDDGNEWQPLQGNLPAVPVHDLQVKDSDLVAATHGRSFWVLDDLSPLRQLAGEIAGKASHLFQPRPTYRTRPLPGAGRPADPGKNYNMGLGWAVTFTEKKGEHGELIRTPIDAGKNPPDGVIVTYWLKEEPKSPVTLTFLDATGNELKSFTSKPDEAVQQPVAEAPAEGEEGEEGVEAPAAEAPEELRVPKRAGANRFLWNLRAADARRLPGETLTDVQVAGPAVPPGSYQVRLSVNGESQTQSFEILKDPRVAASQADLEAQYAFASEVRDRISEANGAVIQIRDLRDQADRWLARAQGDANGTALRRAATALKKRLSEVEAELIDSRAKGALDRLNYPAKLVPKLAGLPPVIASADAAPTRQSREVFAELSAQLEVQLGKLRDLLANEVAELNAAIRAASLDPVAPPSLDDKAKASAGAGDGRSA
ncbi:MAG TPA: glycosyl hydrolase [Dehalococcoidia bacterium]|nr:glycosyl hydrolase [Dehalococcoidia bacterium]